MRLHTAIAIWPKLWGANGYLRTAGYIFVVGHMRSYSSLLSHVLGSHPRIAGYAEMHQKYRSWPDLLELCSKVERSCDKSCAHRQVLDKILHPQVIGPSILRRKDLSVIAIAREPLATLASILSMQAGGIDRLEGAVQYYLERLAALVRLAEMRRGNVFYLDGEAVVERTGEALSSITDYLELAPNLRSDYSTFRFTGTPKYGDPSEWIKSGRVVAHRGKLPEVKLSRSQAEQIWDAYKRMRLYMKRNADVTLFRESAYRAGDRESATSLQVISHSASYEG